MTIIEAAAALFLCLNFPSYTLREVRRLTPRNLGEIIVVEKNATSRVWITSGSGDFNGGWGGTVPHGGTIEVIQQPTDLWIYISTDQARGSWEPYRQCPDTDRRK